jgi:hypothetical protein
MTHTGVTFYEDDRDSGPFMIRIGGTRDFVSKIVGVFAAWPNGYVEVVDGWENPASLKFKTLDEALIAADQVWNIEGFHTSVERSP